MKQSVRFFAALVLLGSLSSPLFSAGASKAKGKLKILVGDDFKNKKYEIMYFLESAEAGPSGGPDHVKHVPLDFAGNTPPGLKTGQTLELTGSDKNGHFSAKEVALISEPAVPQLMATPSGTPSYTGPVDTYLTPPACTHTVLAILLNFSDKPLACTASQVDAVAFSGAGSASNIYRENTFNGFGLQGTVIGPFTLSSASSTCDPYGYSAQANALALAAGYNTASYDHILYVLPAAGCAYGGLSEFNAKRNWLFYCDWTQVFTHELGHNFGLGHASYGSQVYGDDSDTMGYNLRQFNGPHKAQLESNICFNGAPKVDPVIQCGVFNLHALESPSTDDSILKISKPGSGGYYWVSYRVPTGVDSALSATYAYKTSVHYWVGNSAVETYFLDALADGASFVDSVNGITITQLSHDSDHAVVSVVMGTCPNTPTITPSATPSYSPTPTWTGTFSPSSSSTMSPSSTPTPSASPTPSVSLTPSPSSTASPAYSHTFSPTVTPTPATPAAPDCNDPNDHDPWRVKVPGNIVKGGRDHIEILMKPCRRGPSKVWVYDASGDLIWQWAGDTGVGVQANGTVVITMPLQDASEDPLPSGAYRVVYQDASGQQWSTTFVIVR